MNYQKTFKKKIKMRKTKNWSKEFFINPATSILVWIKEE